VLRWPLVFALAAQARNRQQRQQRQQQQKLQAQPQALLIQHWLPEKQLAVAELESRIGGMSGSSLAHRYRELATRRAQISKFHQMLQAEEQVAQDRTSQGLLRSGRERLDGITTELNRHFQKLGGFYEQHGRSSEEKADAALEGKIDGIVGKSLAGQFHQLAARRDEIRSLRQKLKAEEDAAQDPAVRDHLREQREKVDQVADEMGQHFKSLSQLYRYPMGSGPRENTDASLESQIADVAGKALAGQFHELAERREHISDLQMKLKAEEDSTRDKANQGLLHAQRERLDDIAAKMSQHFQSVGQLYGQSHGHSLELSENDKLEAKIANMVGEATANWFHGLAASRDGIQKLRNELQAEEKADDNTAQDVDSHRSLRTQQERLDRLATNLDQHFQSLGDLYGTPGK